MVHNLEAVFRDRLANLPWMSEATRAQALVSPGVAQRPATL
jgi:predicted metalloendopeptidase